MDWLLNSWIIRIVLRPLLDVVILSFLFYRGYRLLVQTRAIPLIRGTTLMVLIYALAFVLQLNTLSWILSFLAPGIFVGLAIVFQPELRKIFTQIGQGGWFSPLIRPSSEHIDAVLRAVFVLSKEKRGALITFVRKVGLKNLVEVSTPVDAVLTDRLLLSIFLYDTPLHDGGVVVQGGKILSAGCVYPVSNQTNLAKNFGTRHRAALGLAEETDAVTIIVSEESGKISLAYNANIFYDQSLEEIKKQFKILLDYKSVEENKE